MNEEQIRALPKVELHCHLDGSLSPAFFEAQLGKRIPPEALCAPPDCDSLDTYLTRFELPLSCLHTSQALSAAGYDVARTMSQETVRYAEIRFAPLLCVTEEMDTHQAIEAVLKGLAKARQDFGIRTQVIVCAMRGTSLEENLAMFRAASDFLGAGVCAGDLAGAEQAYPMSEYRALFAQVRKMGFPFTIHAGECGSAENVEEALHAGASRIGHGVAMAGNFQVQRMARALQAGVEMCPTSNRQTKAVPPGKPYPIREFLRAGLLVSVNTDNRTVSHTSLTQEFMYLKETCQISDEEILLLLRNAIQTSFADEETKGQLMEELA